MQYNIHPIIVHFPIALLFVYSVLKILPLQKWFPKISWNITRITLLVFGVLGALVSLSTGELAEELTNPIHDIVEKHEFFANSATRIYALLLLGEILLVSKSFINAKLHKIQLKRFIFSISNILNNRFVSALLALAGLLAIVLTGLFGGIMVYGVSADPLAPIVLKLFGIEF